MQDSEPDIIDGVGAETGHVIRTSIGGRNGQPKQVHISYDLWEVLFVIWLGLKNDYFYLDSQNVSYIAEHVVGTGSFGVVFQVRTAIFWVIFIS